MLPTILPRQVRGQLGGRLPIRPAAGQHCKRPTASGTPGRAPALAAPTNLRCPSLLLPTERGKTPWRPCSRRREPVLLVSSPGLMCVSTHAPRVLPAFDFGASVTHPGKAAQQDSEWLCLRKRPHIEPVPAGLHLDFQRCAQLVRTGHAFIEESRRIRKLRLGGL